MTKRLPPDQKKRHAGPHQVWSDEEDTRLWDKLGGRESMGQQFWRDFAAQFPGRTFYAVRQRYLLLREKESGAAPKPRVRRAHPVKAQKRHRPMAQEPAVNVPLQLPHTSLTAFLCGDPLPGRSALDQKRGIGA